MNEKDKVHGLELDLGLVKKQVQKLQYELTLVSGRVNECFDRIEKMRQTWKGTAERLTEI
ncbi:MAG: hypothetical protein WED04_09195 [Promethearchaeati archaeon SRVP18_Atabeyarchaeia-1]